MKDRFQNDPLLARTYAKLLKIREKKDLSLKGNPFLKETFLAIDGTEQEFSFRYYQIQAILHLMCMKRFVLGDDTGLGKTAISIGSLCYLWAKNPNQKAVILTTKSAVPQWVEEFEKFTTGVQTFMVAGSPIKRKKLYEEFEAATGPAVLVSGYRSVVNDLPDPELRIQHLRDFVFICDEATAFKNPITQVHKACVYLSQHASRTWGLTATIIKNHLVEGFGIYNVVVPGLFTSKNKFMIDFCTIRYQSIGRNRQVPVIVGHSDEHIRKFKEMIDPYFLGRAKFEVAKELPVLTTKTISVKMSREQRDKYDEALTGLLEMKVEGEMEDVEVTPLTAITRCQQIVNHLDLIGCEGPSGKLNKLIEILTEGDLAEEKVIVFTRFSKMVDLAVPVLEAKLGPGSVVRVTGSESTEERNISKKAFQDPRSDAKVVFITMAGSDAINLHAAKALIFYDTPWSAGDYLQILGRMIRVGSTHDRVYALHLACKASIDGRVMQVLKKKMKIVEAIIGKRIQGEMASGEGAGFKIVNELNELMEALMEDASEMK